MVMNFILEFAPSTQCTLLANETGRCLDSIIVAIIASYIAIAAVHASLPPSLPQWEPGILFHVFLHAIERIE